LVPIAATIKRRVLAQIERLEVGGAAPTEKTRVERSTGSLRLYELRLPVERRARRGLSAAGRDEAFGQGGIFHEPSQRLERGGELAAAMYTLIQTGPLNDVDSQAGLADVRDRTNDHRSFRVVAVALGRRDAAS
jgi:hypothetical protein